MLGALSRDGHEGWLLPSAQGRFLGRGPKLVLGEESGKAEARRAAGRSRLFPSWWPRRDGKEWSARVPELSSSLASADKSGTHPSGKEGHKLTHGTRTYKSWRLLAEGLILAEVGNSEPERIDGQHLVAHLVAEDVDNVGRP